MVLSRVAIGACQRASYNIPSGGDMASSQISLQDTRGATADPYRRHDWAYGPGSLAVFRDRSLPIPGVTQGEAGRSERDVTRA